MSGPVETVVVGEPAQPEQRQRRRFSLGSRVTLLAAACVAGAVALASFGAYYTVRDNLYSQIDESLTQRATAVLNDQLVLNTGGEKLPDYIFKLSDVQFDIIGPDGRTALDAPPANRPPIGQDERSIAAGTSGPGALSIRTDGRTDSRVLAVPYTVAGRSTLALVIAQPLGATKHTLNELSVVLLLIGGAGIIVAALAGTVVARGGLRPVERLTTATERVAKTGDLTPIPVTGDDELARLTQSFNTMLGTVAESQARQRQLVADAGHELRTPLTSLRTNLELLLAAGQRLSDRDRQDIEADIGAQLDELTQLIGDLVELARGDEPRTQFERVELVDVVERALDRARRRAGDIEFDVDLKPWVLTGDSSSLERAVMNLLDNAVKFSPQNGQVRLRLYPLGDGTAVVEVADSGPGIAAEDLPKVFDRFYRSSEARTLPGSGLGLAIVKQAADRHGGAVYAGQAPGGGALLTIRLPGVPG